MVHLMKLNDNHDDSTVPNLDAICFFPLLEATTFYTPIVLQCL